ncbi:aldehyde dehydrogenase [Paenibacillus albicereus]|uniref:Aldehyde dehydrogenase n=1 Tax=Paenibacillus albicereus TaxID=2726185 RepID=A0A6H2GVU5_9BACL|nr:aldehyde dehydrogenase [Paenibacillus albicereus]QJC51527.1 aldehyde dehydrogenase [Paenibacillus albicereus]
MKPVTHADVESMLAEHKRFFDTGATRSIDWRIEQLNRLAAALRKYEQPLTDAVFKDLHKGPAEAYMSEIGFTLGSIKETAKKLRRWAKPERTGSKLFQLPARSRIYREPYGTALIIGPFNYPIQLLVEPLVGAISAGNCAVLKPSENTPHVSAVIRDMIEATFETGFVRVVEGERETTTALIESPFDYIFFTGSVPVGRIVMAAAAKNLVPVTLELGGKSPVIIDRTADLKITARRIMWGKLMNAGQTCVAPDYILVEKDVKEELVRHLCESVRDFYGDDPSQAEFGRIVNERQFDRLADILERDRESIVFGGKTDRGTLYIEPTVLNADFHRSAAMEEELFGPVLPVIGIDSVDEAIRLVNSKPKPLALYLFTKSDEAVEKVIARCSFGGGTVNDTMMHLINPELPFGGVGPSGIGAYHGRHSFELFSHRKSVVRRGFRLASSLTFPPYTPDKMKMIKKFLG